MEQQYGKETSCRFEELGPESEVGNITKKKNK